MSPAPLSAHLSALHLLDGIDVDDVNSVSAYVDVDAGRSVVRMNVHSEPAAERGAVALGLTRQTYYPSEDAFGSKWRHHAWAGRAGHADVLITWVEREVTA